MIPAVTALYVPVESRRRKSPGSRIREAALAGAVLGIALLIAIARAA